MDDREDGSADSGSDDDQKTSSDHEDLDKPLGEGVPLLDPELGKNVEMESISRVPGIHSEMRAADEFDRLIDRMVPEWDPRSREFGLYPRKVGDLHGNAIVAVGPPGGGKTTALVALCMYLHAFIDRAVLVSSTDVRSMQFSKLGLFSHGAIDREPTLRKVDNCLRTMNHEMETWRYFYETGRRRHYRQRSTLMAYDDAGYASEVFSKRTNQMTQVMSNRRHMGAHLIMAIQQMGQLNKQLRMNVGKYIITREHNSSALAAIWEACFSSSDISPYVFRRIVDRVCIEGVRVLVYDNTRTGALFRWTLPHFDKRVKIPMGSLAWNMVIKANETPYSRQLHPKLKMQQLVRQYEDDLDDDQAARKRKGKKSK